jgi:ABC-type nickel/cobalt efflux system permease component RcnA
MVIIVDLVCIFSCKISFGLNIDVWISIFVFLLGYLKHFCFYFLHKSNMHVKVEYFISLTSFETRASHGSIDFYL